MFGVAEDSRNVHGAGQRDEDLLALGVRPEAGNAVAGFLKPIDGRKQFLKETSA